MKRIQPNDTVPLKLTAKERKVVEGLMCLDIEYERAVRDTLAGNPVMMTLGDLDDFGGYIAAEANHCADKKRQKALDTILLKIQRLLETHTDEEPPRIISFPGAAASKPVSNPTAQIKEFVSEVLELAGERRVKTKPLTGFRPELAHRRVLSALPDLPKAIAKKLTKSRSTYTVAEVAGILNRLAENLPEEATQQRIAMLMASKHLIESLREAVVIPAATDSAESARGVSKKRK